MNNFGGFKFKDVLRAKPVRTSGAMRKTFRNFKEFSGWFDEAAFMVANSYQRKDGLEVFLYAVKEPTK
jgi:hypothetical protein